MQFDELTYAEYDEFARKSELRNYLNSANAIRIKEENGWKTAFVGMRDDLGKLVAACGMSFVPVMRKYHYAYAQRGFLCDYHDYELVKEFSDALKDYLIKQGIAYLRIDPYLEYQQLNQDGEVVPDGFNNQGVIDNLKSLGYHHIGFYKGVVNDSQVRYMVVLDLKDQDEASLLKAMDPKTRRNINRAIKLGVKTRQLAPDNLDEFMKLMEFTAEKRDFSDMGLMAYQRQIKAFGNDNAQVIESYLNKDEFLKDINAERAKENKVLADIKQLLIETPGGSKATKRKTQQLEVLKTIDEREKETLALFNEYGDTIVLSAGYFVTYEDEMYYISSGSYDQFRKYNGPYFIQWTMMREALKRGCNRYNFTGTSGIFDESANDYGVYEFKRRFNGYPIELIGEFTLECDSKQCAHIERLTKLKRLIKR